MRGVTADSPRVNPAPAPGAAAAPASVARRLATPVGVIVALGAAFAYVGAVDPNEPGHYPACPLLQYSGIYCPGCGGLRSAYAVAHGDLATAFQANAAAVLGYAFFAVVWTVWVVRAARGRPMHIDPHPAWLWAAGAALLVFTVVRNLPFGGWLHP
ncbi:DUF2752 domain-containing protein [Streptomyces sp. NPDC059477]|uniref:DUF2752 domain-containing protein n=1 Tax=Streptomyces sp. NPDC059477 TaxID=3346847 RepID=UPI0036A45D20